MFSFGSPALFRIEMKAQRGQRSNTALATFRVFERSGDAWTLVAAPTVLANVGQEARLTVDGPVAYDLRFTITSA